MPKFHSRQVGQVMRELALCDPFQMHRSIQILEQGGIPIEAYPQTLPNLTQCTEALYSRLANRRIRAYPAEDLRQHVLNAASVETARGLRLSKEKQSLKIDGAVALSFSIVAAERSEAPGANYNLGFSDSVKVLSPLDEIYDRNE